MTESEQQLRQAKKEFIDSYSIKMWSGRKLPEADKIFIKKLNNLIKLACKKQRKICANIWQKADNITMADIEQLIKNAPSPNQEDK